MTKCKAKTAKGKPCRMAAVKGEKFCFNHSPSKVAERAVARRVGGEHRRSGHSGAEIDPEEITDLESARKILIYAFAELYILDNSVPRDRAMIAVFESYVKSFEIGEHEQRISALEQKRKK